MAQGKAQHRRTHHRFTRSSLLAVALGHLGTGALVAIPLLAAPHAALAQAARSYNIPAGTLEDALNRFGRESGILLSFSTETTAGLKSPGLQGSHTPRSGLDALLAGSGVQAAAQPNGSFVLVKPVVAAGADAELGASKSLEEVRITAQAERSTATEGTGSFTTDHLSMGRGQLARDVPQTVSVVTNQRIREQNLQSVTDVLDQTTGITWERGTFGTTFYSRGLPVTSFQFDGGVATTGSVGYTDNVIGVDGLAQYDRVEVLRGADGLFTGSGEAGGVVNLVRKRPLQHKSIQVTLNAGSWSDHGATLDVSSPLTQDGSVRGRAVIAARDKDFFYKGASEKGQLLYGILEADITANTVVHAGASYDTSDSNKGGELPRYSNGADLQLPRSQGLTSGLFSIDKESTQLFGGLDHKFNDDWNVKLNALYQKVSLKSPWVGAAGAADPQTRSGTRWTGGGIYDSDSEQISLDATVKGAFDLGGRRHEVRFGADYRRENGRNQYATYVGPGIGDLIDLDNPQQPGLSKVIPDALYSPNINVHAGMFGALKLNVADQWKVIVGGRNSYYKYDYSYSGAWNGAGQTIWKQSNVLTPYGALVYEIHPQWTAYGSIAETFISQANLLKAPAPGTPLDAITGRNYELGVKGGLLEGAVNAAFAVYRIERKGEAVMEYYSPGSNCCYLEQGDRVSQGLDMEVNGQIMPGWQLFAGYTFNSNKDKQAAAGRFSTVTPKHLFKLWTNYQLPGDWSRLKIGGGVTAQSAQYKKGTARSWNPASQRWDGDEVAFEYAQPGHAIWSLRTEYKIDDRWNVALNLNNVFDKKYYQTIGSSAGGNYYGAPRNVMVTLRGNF